MIPLFAAPFLLLGCVAFLLCAFVKPLRRFALAAALFFAALGPTILAALAGNGLLLYAGKRIHMPGIGALADGLSLKTFLLIAAVTVPCSAAVVFLHGWILRRITGALFRIYLGVASAAIALCASFFVLIGMGSCGMDFNRGGWAAALAVLFLWCASVVWFCARRAAGFRGTRPEEWQPVSIDEY